RVAVMSGGRILQVASPRELYERPNCREVADFIGEINFFHATVKEMTEVSATMNAGLLGIVTLPRANLAPGIKVDDHILLAIRPEHVRFSSQGLAGEIATTTFLGAHSHFHVRIAGRSERVFVSGDTPPQGAVHLAFPPENLIGLPLGG
ncbi:MAG TPA: TOBE domain-containing protein, partial [Rhizomicrobium sp.]|nr:TOBE domain-containing protein [Rhizomicrobium sp.]